MAGRSKDVPGTIHSRLLVGLTLALPTFLLAGLLLPGAVIAGGDPDLLDSRYDAEFQPGERISTLDGPLNAADPFAVAMKNVGNQVLFDVRIEERRCDGSQTDDLCSVEGRVGGVAGNFIFFDPGSTFRGSSTAPVVVARLYYDRSLLHGVRGFKIFGQKPDGDVFRLPPCDRFDHGGDDRTGNRRTECFSGKKLANGDEVVRIPLSFDPKFTRG